MYWFGCKIIFSVGDNAHRGRIPAAQDRVKKLHQLRQELRERLVQAQERMAKYYDQNHVPKQFKVGDLVKLSTKNLRLKHPKLAPRWIGPFRVTERIGGQAYRLALPEQYRRLHDVFPIQLIESYKNETTVNSCPCQRLKTPRTNGRWRRSRVRLELTANDITSSNGQAGPQSITPGSR